jgi:integrase
VRHGKTKMRDRIGKLPDGRWIFRCQKGHEFTRVKISRGDAEMERASHDVEMHGAGGTLLGVVTAAAKLGTAGSDFLAFFSSLVAAGKKDYKTLKDYDDNLRRLVGFFGKDRSLVSIRRKAIESYISSRLSGSITYNKREVRTGGSRVKKELVFLLRLMDRERIAPDWCVKDFEETLKPEPKAKHVPAADELRRWLDALDPLSRDFVMVKALTAMRNEELYALRVADVDWRRGTIQYVARAKRAKKVVEVPITGHLEPMLRRLCAEKTPHAFVFVLKGRQLQQSSLRKRFLHASAQAKLEVPISCASKVRHRILTFIRNEQGSDAARALANHSSVKVTERFYVVEGSDLETKKKAMEAIALLLG